MLASASTWAVNVRCSLASVTLAESFCGIVSTPPSRFMTFMVSLCHRVGRYCKFQREAGGGGKPLQDALLELLKEKVAEARFEREIKEGEWLPRGLMLAAFSILLVCRNRLLGLRGAACGRAHPGGISARRSAASA